MNEATHVETTTIEVNNHQVRLHQKEITGREIKQAAIEQKVPIEIGFVLFRVEGSKQDPVRDDEKIKVHEREKFRAVAPDDNS